LDTVPESLVQSLKTRFAYVIDMESDFFDLRYITATLVDPKTSCNLLDDLRQFLAIIKDMVRCF
jgi:hypothetical protein